MLCEIDGRVVEDWRDVGRLEPWCVGVRSGATVPASRGFVLPLVVLGIYRILATFTNIQLSITHLTASFPGLPAPEGLKQSRFLANVLYAIARPSVCCLSVVCNARAPYSGGSNFRQYFYGIRYLGHLLTSLKISWRSSRGNPSAGAGELNTRGVAKYSDFGPIDGYISETVQDRR